MNEEKEDVRWEFQHSCNRTASAFADEILWRAATYWCLAAQHLTSSVPLPSTWHLCWRGLIRIIFARKKDLPSIITRNSVITSLRRAPFSIHSSTIPGKRESATAHPLANRLCNLEIFFEEISFDLSINLLRREGERITCPPWGTPLRGFGFSKSNSSLLQC